MASSKQHQILSKGVPLLLLLLGNCNAATAWAHRDEWLEAAFGAPERERFLRNSTSQLSKG